MKRVVSALLLLLAIGLGAEARKITGNVSCAGRPLEGVIVTDGVNFSTTDSDGFFKLKVAGNSRFVQVVTPSGTTADYSSGSPAFYQELSKKKFYTFKLISTSPSTDYTLFSVSDPQMQNPKHLKKFLDAPLKDLISNAAAHAAKRNTVGIALGDLGWNRLEIYPDYKQAIARTGIPFYSVIGNHDYIQTLSGDAAARTYEDFFGPRNWAFFLGNDLVIGLNNIQFLGNGLDDPSKSGKYDVGYSRKELSFVQNLLSYIPEDTHIFIAQHSPLYFWFKEQDCLLGDEMLALLEGRKVDFLSGHTHILNNLTYSDDIHDHNAASICGTWWETDICNDGTPRGYEIFNNVSDSLSWYWHNIDFPDDYQVEFIPMGQSMYNPNSVVANVWDYDPRWSVEWYQDGVFMGSATEALDVSPTFIKSINAIYEAAGKEIPKYKRPRRNIHYFTVTPTSQYASSVELVVRDPAGKEWKYRQELSDYVDVQAHRGGAGLMPEDTWESMKNGLDLGVNTLELDLQISADSLVVVSHDSWFHHRCSTRPDGTPVLKSDPKEYLFRMPYDSIARYDVGMLYNDVWPDKKLVPAVKPLLSDLIDRIEEYTAVHKLSPTRYNVEIKSRDKKGEGVNWPDYKSFTDLCVNVLLSKNLGDRLIVQCFDTRALNYMHEKYPELFLAYLTDHETDVDAFMGLLDFKPDWWSPNYEIVTPELVERFHSEGIKVVPWTPDKVEDLQRMIDCGVDAIITNYPDRLLMLTRGYVK